RAGSSTSDSATSSDPPGAQVPRGHTTPHPGSPQERMRNRMQQLRLAISTVALSTLALVPAAANAQATAGRVAYGAVQAVMQRTPGYAQADSTWNREFEGYQREMTQLQARMDSAAAAFDQQAVMLSASAREA